MLLSGLELWQWRIQAKTEAIKEGIEPSEIDWILREIIGLDKLSLRLESFKHQREIDSPLNLTELTQLWQRRLFEKVPVQYLAGCTPWRNFSLIVTPAVLIPRPETEQIIDIALEACQNSPENLNLQQGNWTDLGTGSGAIALGLAEVLTKATIHAVDFSFEALEIAKKNANKLGFTDRIKFYQGSWLEPLQQLKGQLAGIISNPPYIPADIVPQLQPEVSQHEPHLALSGGQDGLECIRHLVQTAPEYLEPGGIWLIEMMAGQADKVVEFLQNNGNYQDIQIFSDLAGIERFALAYKKGNG